MMNNVIYSLYLGGPILGCEYTECTDWRQYTADKLPPYIKALSPMRGKAGLSTGSVITTSDLASHPLCSPKRLTTRDRNDVIMRADALLMNFLHAERVSIGSVGEIFWADAFRKPVIIVMEPDNIHNHVMIKEIAGFITPDLDEGIEFAISLFS